MSDSTSWGKDGSKGRVICLYREEECRKDNLKRHTSSKHKGQPPKSKLKSIGGQKKLKFFTPHSSQNENGTLFPSETSLDELNESINFNYSNYVFAAASMQKQPPSLLRLKAHIVERIHESQTHKTLLEKRAFDSEKEKERQLRVYKIGMNIERIRYNGIKQGRSYLAT